MNYFEHHIGDYLKDTAHLSLLEHGIYRRLMDVYYTREAALPAAEVARLIGARSRDEKDALQAVLGEFFVLDGDRWTQARCDAEIARFQDKQRKAKASADARWSKTDRNANASETHDAPRMRSHSEGNATRAPVPSPQSPDTIPSEAGASSGPRRASRLAADWEPGESGAAFALSLGMLPERTATELAKFRDFWAAKAGKDGAKLDWQATWRNWLRSASERMPRAGANAPNRQEALEERNRAVGRSWAAKQQEAFDDAT